MRGRPFFCEIPGVGNVGMENQEGSSHTDLFLEEVYTNLDNLETDY